jgi:HEAT repeat protein
MSETQDKKDAPSAPAPPVQKEVPLDTRLLSEAVIELNISRKNVGIYPPGHIQITKSIDRAYDILQKMFEIRAEMTLGVAKDTLLVGQDYLDRKNPVYRDFALSLSQQGIAAITFIRGLGKDELVRFHRVITTKPEDVRSTGGIDKIMAEAGIPHIRIQAIDYGSFHVTEEQEIFKPQGGKGGAGEKSGASLWQDFVAHLTTGTLAGPGEGVSLKEAEQVDPAELARLLNERKLDPGSALQSYDRIISEHVRVRAEQKQLTQEQSVTLSSLNTLLKDLHPELRKQFLSVAFRRISSHTAAAGAEELVGGFSDDIVIEMLSQASAEGREISPTLTGLLGKLTRATSQSAASGNAAGPLSGAPGKGEPSSAILPEDMKKLFNREKYEEYVSEDYEAMLKSLTATASGDSERIPVEEYAKTLEEDHLDFQIGRALIAFMEENIDEEDYREFAGKLIAIMPGFLKTGNFMLLWDIFETLRRHTVEKPVKEIRFAAHEARQAFLAPAFIANVLNYFDIWMKNKGQEAAGLIQALGPGTTPGLLDLFSSDEGPGGRRVVFNLLCAFGEPAVKEAQKRLYDPRPYYVRNLLMLIRRAGTPAAIPFVKPLLQHRDQSVRMEALSALLRFKDPGAIKVLKDFMHSSDPDVAFQAVALAGQYRVTEVIGDILAKIKKMILFEADYGENEEIIKALSDIGDPRVIPELEKLAKARTLYPQRRVKMQRLLYASLDRYPRESIAGLLKIGERSTDDEIRKSCKKLREQR